MKVLITGAASLLGQTLAESLKHEHHLRLQDTRPIETSAEFIQGDIRDQQISFRACEGMEAIVHLCDLPDPWEDKSAWEQDVIDRATRGTHNLLKAAVAAGSKRTVYIGTLKIFLRYPEKFAVTEFWKPRPDPDDAFQMAKFLGELTVREFARNADLPGVCLRVGNMVLEEECENLPFDPLWVDVRDVASAVSKALAFTTSGWHSHYRWWLHHVIADHPRSRFLVNAGRRAPLGFSPEHHFTFNKEA